MYVCGKNVVKEYIRNNRKIYKAFLYNNFNDDEILDYLKRKNIQIEYFKDKRDLDKLNKGNHQGVIIRVDDYEYADIDDFVNKDDALIVILDHIEDPHNFGAIIRTCEAAGVDGIIIPKDRSCEVTDTVIRTSVGASDYMKIAEVTNLTNTINNLKDKGYWFVGMDMDGEDYTKIDYKGKIGLIVGSEGFGMKRLVKESCDFIASIPMNGKVNSLNASVAAGIIIYEAIKLRK